MARHNPQPVVEFADNYFRLSGIVIEVLLLAGNFEMSATGEVTIDLFLADDRLHAINRGQRSSIHASGALAAIHRNQLVNSKLQASKDHAAVARAGAPAGAFSLQDGDRSPKSRQVSSRGQASESGSHHRHVHAFGQRHLGAQRHLRSVQPEVMFAWTHVDVGASVRRKAGPSTSVASLPSGRDDNSLLTRIIVQLQHPASSSSLFMENRALREGRSPRTTRQRRSKCSAYHPILFRNSVMWAT